MLATLLAVLLPLGLVQAGDDLTTRLDDMVGRLETSRGATTWDLARDLRDGYISLSGHRLNTIMKTLTIASVIFLPLTFLAGVYGMNFDRSSPWNMPELGWKFGYPFALLLMLVIGSFLIWVFRSRRWL